MDPCQARRGTTKFATKTCTASPSWFSVVVRTLISPCSGRDFEGRTSRTSLSRRSSTFVGLTGLTDATRPAAIKALPGHDFSALLAEPEKAGVQAVRPAVLFQYAEDIG
jgi:hypothetical protein